MTATKDEIDALRADFERSSTEERKVSRQSIGASPYRGPPALATSDRISQRRHKRGSVTFGNHLHRADVTSLPGRALCTAEGQFSPLQESL